LSELLKIYNTHPLVPSLVRRGDNTKIMDITIMEGLQIALLSVSTVAVIALTAVLIRVFRLLGPVLEIIGIYKKVRAVFM